MKKLTLVLAGLLIAGALSAADINLGSFPLGSWLDGNYDAVWEFKSDNIRILDSESGDVLWDFADKTIENFKVDVIDGGPAIVFSCPEAGRSYTFIKPLTSSDITMKIDRDGKAQYSVKMAKQ